MPAHQASRPNHSHSTRVPWWTLPPRTVSLGQRRILQSLTGGPGLGDVTSSSASSAVSEAATGAMIGMAAGPVGAAIGAAVGAAVGFLTSLFGNSEYHIEESKATAVVNTIENEMHQNVGNYQATMHTYSQQQAALAYFDQLWTGLVAGCQCLGSPGTRCIQQRQRGGQYDDFASGRDPISNDPNVVADDGYQLVLNAGSIVPASAAGTAGNNLPDPNPFGIVGEVAVGECPPNDTMTLVPAGDTASSGAVAACNNAVQAAAGSTATAAGTTVAPTTSTAAAAPSLSNLFNVNPLYLAGGALALFLVLSLGGHKE